MLIESFEGFKPEPYLDSKGIPTIGIGTVYYPNGKRVTLSDSKITLNQALNYLEANVSTIVNKLNSLELSLNQNQFDALCSFIYNVGMGAFLNSTLLDELKENQKEKAADQFLLWDHENGKEVTGLLKRRMKERELFLS